MIYAVATLYRNAFRGLSLNSWYLSLVILINRSGTMVVPFLTVYCIRRLGFSIEQAGFVMAMFGCGAIAGAFFGGKITDKFGFYYLQVGALLSGGVCFVLLGFLQTYVSLCIGTFVLSLFNESFRPANSAAIAAYSDADNRTRSYALNRLAINIGWSFGGAVGGFLAAIDYHLLFWVDGITNIFGALLLLRLIPYRSAVKPAGPAESPVPANSAYRDRRYLTFIVLTALFATAFFQLFTIQPAFLKTVWNFSEQAIGVLMAVNGMIIVLFEMVVVHRLENRRHALWYIAIGLLICTAGNCFFNILPATFITAALVVATITFGEILIIPFMNSYWISRSKPANRGQYAGLYSIAWATAQIISPSLSSIIAARAGFSLLWWLTAGLCVITSAVFYGIYRAERAENQSV